MILLFKRLICLYFARLLSKIWKFSCLCDFLLVCLFVFVLFCFVFVRVWGVCVLLFVLFFNFFYLFIHLFFFISVSYVTHTFLNKVEVPDETQSDNKMLNNNCQLEPPKCMVLNESFIHSPIIILLRNYGFGKS